MILQKFIKRIEIGPDSVKIHWNVDKEFYENELSQVKTCGTSNLLKISRNVGSNSLTNGASGETRTRTPFRAADFESVSLANSFFKSLKIRNQLAVNNTKFKFDQYRPHDDRRLNITLQCLDLCTEINDVVEICCQLHGQSSREVFAKYFQWGQMQRRIKKKEQLGKLTIIALKK